MDNETIVLLDELDEQAISLLKTSKYKISSEKQDIKNASAFLVRSSPISRNLINIAPNLRVIVRAGVGLDTIDTTHAYSKNITVYNTPSVYTHYAVETTMALILASQHKIIDAHNSLYKEKIWDRKTYHGSEIFNKSLGIVGFGNIGSQLAKVAKSFGMKIKAFDPYVSISQNDVEQKKNLDDLITDCEILSLHLPLNAETTKLITKRELKMMKPSTLLVNSSRGNIINENDLIYALQKKWISAAALDVFGEEPLPRSSPFFELDNVIMLPHLGGAGIECRKHAAIEAVKMLLNFLDKL